ncbi:hypothetical protein A1O3_01078 [Capronia epimyces CBS 606.96]|uniref:Uncharacterized protein n=1 Tax=Capronia epimyces CBS 606.96 TaxID=1182542 RepID=W9YTE9_9EURO|nr:uncharacterized protein A1O3_01078 [Capronia epimyces CBS 606.96]EXJ92526.1 hypothetical protein A1O3_01078 [Capronia epimyces CBS 606.96]
MPEMKRQSKLSPIKALTRSLSRSHPTSPSRLHHKKSRLGLLLNKSAASAEVDNNNPLLVAYGDIKVESDGQNDKLQSLGPHANDVHTDIESKIKSDIECNIAIDDTTVPLESWIEVAYFADPSSRLHLSSNPGEQGLHRAESARCSMANYVAEIDRRVVGNTAMRDFAYEQPDPLHSQAYGHADGQR